MSAKNTDDDEELLLLRIEALRSTPGVNTSFEFSSDSDTGQNLSFKNETNHDSKGKQSDDTNVCDEIYSSNNDNNIDDEDESELRQVALRSLCKSTRRSSGLLKSGSNSEYEYQPSMKDAFQNNVPTCPVSTESNCSQHSFIPVNEVMQTKLQDLSAIQHDLVSSTSGEISQNVSIEELENPLELCNQPISSYLEPTPMCTQSLCISNPKGIDNQPTFNTALSCSISTNSTNTIILSCNQSLNNTNSEIKDNGLLHNNINSEIKDNELLHNNINSEMICSEGEDNEVTYKNTKFVTSKNSPMISEVEVNHVSDLNYQIQSNKGCSYQDEMPPFKSNEIESCGRYSPSVVCVNDDSHHEIYTTSCHDDVISLCTSDKEENELNSSTDEDLSNKETKCTVFLTDVRHSRKYLNINLSPTYDNQYVSERNKNDKDGSSASIDSFDIQFNIDTETSELKFNETSHSEFKETSDKIIPSAESGLDTVLDRYIDEVAATKKKLKESNLLLCSETKFDVHNDKEWVDCEPGPSGYIPTIVDDYDSDSDESIRDTTPVEGSKSFNQHLLSCCDMDTCECALIGKREIPNPNDENFKISLEEQNIHEDGKREDMKDVTCPICLGPFENRSFLHLCFHSFCYMCIIQWSELSRLCPLCKTKYVSLIHSVNTDLDYLTYEFPDDLPEKKTLQQQREFSETMDDGRRFRYRSTIVDHQTWAARRDEREHVEQENMVSRQQRNVKQRLHWSTTKRRRKAVYAKGLNVKEVKQRGKPKFRDITPKFFEENPALKHRLVPWLLRDLSVLLGNTDDDIRFVMSLILNLVSKVYMGGDKFKDQLRPFLLHQTDHFVAELVSFASSPYDIRGYDENAKYDKPSSDVEIISSPFSVNTDPLNTCSINDAEPTVLSTVEIPSDDERNTVTFSEKHDDVKPKDDVLDQVQLSNTSNEDTSNIEDTSCKEEKKPKKEVKKKKKRRHKRKGKYLHDKRSHRKKNDTKDITKQNGEKIGGKNIELVQNKESTINKETVKDYNTKTIVNLLQASDGEKDSGHKRTSSNKKKRFIEKRKKHKHKRKGKHGKHKRRKRKRSTSDDSFSEYEYTSKKIIYKKCINIIDDKHANKGKSEGEQGKEQKNCTVNSIDGKKIPVKKSLKRKGTTLGSGHLLKRKKKDTDEHNIDIIGNHKKKVKKKKKKHKHKKGHQKKKNFTQKKSSLKNKADCEIQSKIDHAINTITKGITSSGDEDDLLNLQEIQDLLCRYKLNDNLDLIKDGDGYKTRAEVVHELLLIEKAITRRQEKKQKQKGLHQTSNSTLVVGNSLLSPNETCEKPNSELIKVRKKVEREKSYNVLIKELQEIEGRINSCRSSLQSKPPDMIEANM